MFLFLNVFEGIDENELTQIFESSGRCKRVVRNREYKNDYDVYEMCSKFIVSFDIVRMNHDFWNKQIKIGKIINIPCRPDIVYDFYFSKYNTLLPYFSRLRRMKEIATYKNCLTIPYENLFANINCVQNFLGIGKEFVVNKRNFERTDLNANWSYDKEIKKIKICDSWYEKHI